METHAKPLFVDTSYWPLGDSTRSPASYSAVFQSFSARMAACSRDGSVVASPERDRGFRAFMSAGQAEGDAASIALRRLQSILHRPGDVIADTRCSISDRTRRN